MDNPLISHFYSIQDIELYACLSNQARLVLERFAPGPITIVLKKKKEKIFTSGLSTIAVRIPSHPQIREVLRLARNPIAAPSANFSGKPSITREETAIAVFRGLVDCILTVPEEGKEIQSSGIGLESTVLDMTTDRPKILRPGSIEKEELEETLGCSVEIPEHPEVLSPGIKYKHYAPEGKIMLFHTIQDAMEILNQIPPSSGIAILAYSDSWEKVESAEPGKPESRMFIESLGLSQEKDRIYPRIVRSNSEYAGELYDFFLDADKKKASIILCEKPREGKLFSAIYNRLNKAVG